MLAFYRNASQCSIQTCNGIVPVCCYKSSSHLSCYKELNCAAVNYGGILFSATRLCFASTLLGNLIINLLTMPNSFEVEWNID